jgi:hypothetical protein
MNVSGLPPETFKSFLLCSHCLHRLHVPDLPPGIQRQNRRNDKNDDRLHQEDLDVKFRRENRFKPKLFKRAGIFSGKTDRIFLEVVHHRNTR